MQVELKRSYAPAKLGFIPPKPFPFGRLGASFPEAASPQASMMEGFVSKGATDGILLAIGGAGLTYFSRFFPGVGEPVGLVSGLGLLGVGAFKFYGVVTGQAEPNVQSTSIPANQLPEEVYQLRAKIVTPVNNSKAELSSMWTALFGTQRTFKISFSVTNVGTKAVTAQVEFHTQQFTRPLIGKSQQAEFSTNFLLDKIAPGETRLVTAWHPIEIFFTFAPQDIVGSLILRASAIDPGQTVATVNFITGD